MALSDPENQPSQIQIPTCRTLIRLEDLSWQPFLPPVNRLDRYGCTQLSSCDAYRVGLARCNEMRPSPVPTEDSAGSHSF